MISNNNYVGVVCLVSSTDDVDVSVLQMQLNLSMKKTSHVTELLRESEENGVRLTDQAKLLKEEIRRLLGDMRRETERERERGGER